MLAVEETKLKRRLSYCNALRISILGALILVILIVHLFFALSTTVMPLLASLVVAVAIAILYIPLSRKISVRILIYLQLTIDIFIITILVYFSGGVVSPFYFLYILPIILAAYFLSRRETFYFAFFCFIIFGLLSNLLYLELIPFFPGTGIEDVPLLTYIYNLLMSFIAFTIVSVLSSFFFRKLRETGEELRHIQENLQDMIVLNSSVLEKMESGFITTNMAGRVISYNERAHSLTQVNTLVNVFSLLFSNSERAEVEKLHGAHNYLYLEKKVGQRDLGISISVLEQISGFDWLYVFLLTDLTDRKKIEAKLKEKEELAMIGQMLAGIAHEIRNPLASISGSVQFLKKECRLSPEFQNLMNIIVRESDRLSKSIDSILDFSKPVALNLQVFSLSALLDEIIEMISHSYPQVRFIRRYSQGDEVEADPEKIKQVIWNIVNNGIKAVHEKGSIEITIFHRDGAVYLSIRDDGEGMDKVELAQVFSLFYSRFTAGIGLGMYTVKRILEEHGFRIRIEAEKNSGTEVIICMKKESRY